MFIPGLGALIRLRQSPMNPRENARVGLAGPLWGLGAAVASYEAATAGGGAMFLAIASTGAWLNLFNLLPVWQLDGNRIAHRARAVTSTATPPMTPHPLERFTTAQDAAESGFDAALAEMRAGRKRGHWIWYVFPQLSGLGGSQMSQAFGIDGAPEAADYLRHPVLSARLLTITNAVAEGVARGVPLDTLMGSRTDVLKLVSSLTLFEQAARQLQEPQPNSIVTAIADAAATVLAAAESEGYKRCGYTLDRLARR